MVGVGARVWRRAIYWESMGDRLEEMPLFPLNTVLFPYAQLQLHVCEERYREMVRTCSQNDQPFGVVLIRTGNEAGDHAEPYMVGTAARIVSIHTFDDGKMDVQVRGERRFRVRRLDDSQTYLVGWVEPVMELEIQDMDRAEDLVMTSRDYVQAYIEWFFSNVGAKVAQIKLPGDPTALSFVVANFLQIENLEKQRLLEQTDTLERLNDMIPILEQHLVEAKAPYHRMTRQHAEEIIGPN